jgi:hypothetical protein
MKIHRHPSTPNVFFWSISPEIGAPSSEDTGMAAMKTAIARARSRGRNHRDR